MVERGEARTDSPEVPSPGEVEMNHSLIATSLHCLRCDFSAPLESSTYVALDILAITAPPMSSCRRLWIIDANSLVFDVSPLDAIPRLFWDTTAMQWIRAEGNCPSSFPKDK